MEPKPPIQRAYQPGRWRREGAAVRNRRRRPTPPCEAVVCVWTCSARAKSAGEQPETEDDMAWSASERASGRQRSWKQESYKKCPLPASICCSPIAGLSLSSFSSLALLRLALAILLLVKISSAFPFLILLTLPTLRHPLYIPVQTSFSFFFFFTSTSP